MSREIKMSNMIDMTRTECVGGVYTQDTPRFHRGVKCGLSRSLKANVHDAGVAIPVSHRHKREITNEDDSCQLRKCDGDEGD